MRYALNKTQLGAEVLAQNDVTWFCATPFFVLLLLQKMKDWRCCIYLVLDYRFIDIIEFDEFDGTTLVKEEFSEKNW